MEFESEVDDKTDAKTIIQSSFEINEESTTVQADSEVNAQTDQGKKKTVVQRNKWLAPVSKRPTVITVLAMEHGHLRRGTRCDRRHAGRAEMLQCHQKGVWRGVAAGDMAIACRMPSVIRTSSVLMPASPCRSAAQDPLKLILTSPSGPPAYALARCRTP